MKAHQPLNRFISNLFPFPALLALLTALVPSLGTACSGDTSNGPLSSDEAGAAPALVSDDAAAGDDASTATTWTPPYDATPTPAPGTEASAPLSFDASSPAPSPEAGPDASCTQPLGQGVLMIDELMIEAVAGTGDYGQWLEVQSTSSCAVNLNGLHGECANGAKLRTFDVTDDLWIPPAGFFVVADSGDPAINHYLPGTVVTWAGQPGDVLRTKGATVTLSAAGTLVDTVTYPAFKLTVGVSIAFPSDCPASSRSDWTSWQPSTSSWFPGFLGTPNAPNDDVSCP
jgi:hypothetical protein